MRALVAPAALACVLACSAAGAEEARFAATARSLLADAHGQAAQDRHGRAITCALAALRLDPALEPDAALLIANQLTWSDRPEEAIPWYRKHLEHYPGDCDGSLGLARALSWTGRLDEASEIYRSLGEECTGPEGPLGAARMEAWKGDRGAAAERYREVLGAEPGSREAAHGLAEAENARGRHRRAEEIYRRLLEEDPSDERARVGLARAQYWMGRNDLALETLAPAPGAAAASLRATILDEARLRFEAEGSAFTDVEDQDLESFVLSASGGWHPRSGGRLELVHATTREPGSPDVRAVRGLAGGWWRASTSLSLNAYAGAVFPRADAAVDAGEGEVRSPDEIERARAVWDAWAAWTPADWTRIDLGYAGVPIETPKSIARRIRVDLLALTAERRIVDELLVRARAALGDYTDGNRRQELLAEADWGPIALGGRVAIHVGAGGSLLSFDQTVDRGYYSPDRYDAVWGLLKLEAALGAGFRLDSSSRVGSEREGDGGRFGVWQNAADLAWSRGAIEIVLFGRHSTSRFDTSAGYGRKGWGVLLAASP